MTVAEESAYREHLRSRWPTRTRLLAAYAFFGTPVLVLFDCAFTSLLGGRVPLATIAALRLPWMALPIAAWALQRLAPGGRHLPLTVVALSLAWSWGNDLPYFALGLGGTVVQVVAVFAFISTVAIVMPLVPWRRGLVFGLLGAGHVALDLTWPQARPASLRLWTDAVLLTFMVCETYVFEAFAGSRRRAFHLRWHLERTVQALELSHRRAAEAAASVSRLAASVAHDVNNPLAAVKVNVRWLREADAGGADGRERAEVIAETLEAVERIARIVSALNRRAAQHPDGHYGEEEP